MTLSRLDKSVMQQLRMDMTDSSAISRMEVFCFEPHYATEAWPWFGHQRCFQSSGATIFFTDASDFAALSS